MKRLFFSMAIALAFVSAEAKPNRGGANNNPHPNPNPQPQGKSSFPGQNSGLSWMTGLANTDRNNECQVMQQMQAGFLHRKADVFAGFFTHDDIDNTTSHLKAKRDNWNCFTKQGVVLSQVLPILVTNDVKNVNEVLNPGSALHKKYIGFWTQFANLLKETGQTKAFLRLGHEMNLGGGYPWAVPNNVSAAQFVALYKLAADTVKPIVPGAKFVWNPGKSSTLSVDQMYPGDNYVDVVGVDWYDNGGGGVRVLDTEADWTAGYMKSNANGPQGVGAWYAYAKKHNKPIAFPEWAMKDGKGSPSRTVYVQHMHDFFSQAAREGFMAYESWYNEPGQHRIYPNSQFPQAASLYQKIFQPGK